MKFGVPFEGKAAPRKKYTTTCPASMQQNLSEQTNEWHTHSAIRIQTFLSFRGALTLLLRWVLWIQFVYKKDTLKCDSHEMWHNAACGETMQASCMLYESECDKRCNGTCNKNHHPICPLIADELACWIHVTHWVTCIQHALCNSAVPVMDMWQVHRVCRGHASTRCLSRIVSNPPILPNLTNKQHYPPPSKHDPNLTCPEQKSLLSADARVGEARRLHHQPNLKPVTNF